MQLHRIGILSAAKVAGVLYAGLGLLFGGIFSLISIVAMVSGEGGAEMLFGVAAVIIAPIIYGIMGALMAALMAALYNLIAKTVGGLELDIS